MLHGYFLFCVEKVYFPLSAPLAFPAQFPMICFCVRYFVLVRRIPSAPAGAKKTGASTQTLRLFLPAQFQLFLPGQLLDLILPSGCGGPVGMWLGIHQLQRAAPTGILGALARAVGSKTLFHIIRNAGVDRTVPTAQHIHIPIHSLTPFRKQYTTKTDRTDISFSYVNKRLLYLQLRDTIS